ncbi:MAG TPA: hypothetical protein VHF67_02500 [Gaiellaceae bacterium]|nr:hypothetical protein [Gaiellaceae bacterium]
MSSLDDIGVRFPSTGSVVLLSSLGGLTGAGSTGGPLVGEVTTEGAVRLAGSRGVPGAMPSTHLYVGGQRFARSLVRLAAAGR